MTLTIHIPSGDAITLLSLGLSTGGLIYGHFQSAEVENSIQMIIALYLMVSIYLERLSNRVYESW